MVKQINIFGATVKTFLEKGYSQSWIAKKLKVKRQRVNYWALHPLKTEQKKKKKLPDEYIKKIIDLSKNKTTSTMSSSRITKLMNLILKRDKKNITISKATVCRILKNEYGKPRKIKKVFYLNQKQKDERLKFCKMMLEKGITGEQIFFTDETKIEMGSYINDHIRLSKENQEKLKTGDENVFQLINRPQKKYEFSIMIAGGICSQGLSDLIILEGPENEFSYGQILMYYKDNFDKFKKEGLLFEQDGAPPHTSTANKSLIKKLFGEESYIQNPPNSPDIAYPIETLWGYLKPRIKKRDPKNIEELKNITLEEWKMIPKKRIKNCGMNFVRRLKKIIEIKGNRLEEYHLREIRKEALKEEKKVEEDELDNGENGEAKSKEKQKRESSENLKEEDLKIKYAYNDILLAIMKKKEITKLKKTINEIKEKYKKDEKNIEINALTRLMKNTTLKSEEKAKKKIKLKNVENTKKKIKLKKGEKAKKKIKKDTGSKIIKEAKKK